ncbi:MAG: glycoside hydrolase family 16 protein [Planctomycetota bacterium]
MKLAALLVLVAAAAALSGAEEEKPKPKEELEPDKLPPAPPGKTWKLVWHDEFSGAKLDETKWEVPESLPEIKRHDAEWSREAVKLDDIGHHLVISTFKEGDKYYDGCVQTKGKFEHAFGYYVARLQMQKEPGHWPAFWLYNECVNREHDGREGTEIDIMEKPFLDERVLNGLHWRGYGEHQKSARHVSKAQGLTEGFHTFALLWTPEEYVFYTDAKETWRSKEGGVCQVPLYIKISDEVEAKGWAGDLSQASLPDQFVVDYVRVYDLVEEEKEEEKEEAK